MPFGNMLINMLLLALGLAGSILDYVDYEGTTEEDGGFVDVVVFVSMSVSSASQWPKEARCSGHDVSTVQCEGSDIGVCRIDSDASSATHKV